MHSNIIPPSVWADVDENTGLDVPANRLRQYLEIPDITTRSGLRQVHANFGEISRRLDEVYDAALSHGVTRGASLVCIIWAKMAADVVLRRQLIREGLVCKIIPLLGTPSGGVMVLGLVTMLVDTDVECALEVFRHNLDIVQILRDHPEDAEIIGNTIMTLAQSFVLTVFMHSSSYPNLFDDACLVPVLSALLDVLRHRPDLLPEVPLRMAMAILTRMPPLYLAHSWLKDVPGLLSYYASISRADSLRMRCNAVTSTWLLARVGQPVLKPDENVQLVVIRSSELAGRTRTSQDELLFTLPEDLRSLMSLYGVASCESVVDFTSSAEATSALSRYYQDDDLCALGLRLAELLQLTEFAIDPNADLDVRWHRRASDGSKLKELDVLPLCAAALAEREGTAELDAADVLRLHYMLATRADPTQVYLRAQHVMRRNPSLAYAHYAYAMSFSLSPADVILRVRALTEAAACDGQTPLLQCQLAAQAVKTAGEHAFCTLRQPVHGLVDVTPKQMTSVKLALDAANVYLHMAPPDARQRVTVLSWYVVLRLIVDAPRPGEDMSHYEPLLDAIRTAEKFADIFHRDRSPAKTDIQLTREWLFEQYQSGSIRQWDLLIPRLQEMGDDLLQLINAPSAIFSFASVAANKARLDQCSWCQTLTVSVKKCARCGEARYCNTICQKADWPVHKASCHSSAPA